MNEAETGAELIDPALKAAGWGVAEGSKIFREYGGSAGKIKVGGRGKRDSENISRLFIEFQEHLYL